MSVKQKYKLKDVAKAAGVSITTVSRVLNNNLKVKPEVEKRIKETVAELGYVKKISVDYNKNINSVSTYYEMLIKNIRIRSIGESVEAISDFESFEWKKDKNKLEKSLLWSPSNLKAKVAYVSSGMTHPYWVHQWSMIQKVRDRYFPNMELKLFDAKLDKTRMINHMKDAVSEGYDAVIVSNHLGSSAYPGYGAVNEAGIPLIIYTTGAPCDDVYSMDLGNYDYVTVVRPDEVTMGEKLASYFAIKLKGKGNIIIVQGMSDSTDNLSRRVGLQNELDYYPDIKIIADVKAYWRSDAGYKVMNDMLHKYPEPNSINGVISVADEQTVGVVQAVKEHNRREEMLIGSFDVALTGLIMIRNGDIDVSARFESKMEGVHVLDSVAKALNGQKVPKFRRQLAPLITKINYSQFLDNPDSVIWEKTDHRDLPWLSIEEYMEK